MKKISLTHMKPNHKGAVLEIAGCLSLENKLASMGIYKGKDIIKLSHIGLQGPVVIKSGRSIIALGHGIAAKIIIGIE
ncbi:MAG: FeoA family protein [Candidatus Omnitrophica bacterium]|nr:FeoA family protein [Candidatus Omnitrophota bacterium]